MGEAAHGHAQQLLLDEIARRRTDNPRYSLRAFARTLGVSHTVLSLFLSGRRPLSLRVAHRIVGSLALSPQQQTQFLQGCRRPVSQDEAQCLQIELDTFELISGWQHYALLSLLRLPEMRWDAAWVARRLGISAQAATELMQTLERLQMVEVGADGGAKRRTQPLRVNNAVSTSVTRAYHHSVLARALQSLDTDPIESRDFSSITFAMDPSQVAWAQQRITRFRRELCRELEKRGEVKEVYNFSLQLFPLSQEEKHT